MSILLFKTIIVMPDNKTIFAHLSFMAVHVFKFYFTLAFLIVKPTKSFKMISTTGNGTSDNVSVN